MSSIISEYQINILRMWLIIYQIVNAMWNTYGFLLRVLQLVANIQLLQRQVCWKRRK
jgi:hypothetical protein